MDKEAAQVALDTIWAKMLDADNKTFHGKEIGELNKACRDLLSAVDTRASHQAQRIVSMLESGVLAVPQGKSKHRDSILALVEELRSQL